MSDILTRMGFTIGAGIILSGDHQERSVANRQFIQAKESITTLRQQLADMTARAEEAEKVAQRLYQKLDGMIV
jgi:ATP-dependent protease ClpP protease subunit